MYRAASQKCLREGVFPEVRKRRSLVLLPDKWVWDFVSTTVSIIVLEPHRKWRVDPPTASSEKILCSRIKKCLLRNPSQKFQPTNLVALHIDYSSKHYLMAVTERRPPRGLHSNGSLNHPSIKNTPGQPWINAHHRASASAASD